MRRISAAANRDYSQLDWEELVRGEDADHRKRPPKAMLPVLPFSLAIFIVTLVANGLNSGGLQQSVRKEWSNSGLASFVARVAPGQSQPAKYSINDLNAWVPLKQSRVNSGWLMNSEAVRPREMRVWAPSVNLTNYRLRFTAQLDRKAMSWAFRANDANNYYATRIVITEPGPLPRADVVHYATIKGSREAQTSSRLPVLIHNDTLYNVEVSVHGSQFTTSVNGQIVDTWQDGRLKRGGVAFFSEAGEDARVYKLSLTDSDTFVGTLVEFLSFAMPQDAGVPMRTLQ